MHLIQTRMKTGEHAQARGGSWAHTTAVARQARVMAGGSASVPSASAAGGSEDRVSVSMEGSGRVWKRGCG